MTDTSTDLSRPLWRKNLRESPLSKWSSQQSLDVSIQKKIIMHNLPDGNITRSRSKIKAKAALAKIDWSYIVILMTFLFN